MVKLLHARGLADPRLVDRFLREAQLASRLDHPYAAHVYAFGAEPDGLLWIAMERVRGTSLAQVLASQPGRRMPLHRFVHLLELICEVVHVAHEQGIVHRDLKPSNIMVLARAGRLLPKLLDFGVARRVGEPGPPRGSAPEPVEATGLELTQPGAHLGSPLYMAPEQWTDLGAVDARADIYALGVLAFEALTGRVPFTGRTVGEIARQHVTAEVPALPADLPAALEPVLRAALAKQKADRPASALAFAEALRVAAGVNLSAEDLPRLDVAVRRDAAWLPQPIADAVAGFEAARNPHQARDALWKIVHVAVRYLGVVALAACSRGGPGAIDSPVAVARVRELRHRDLADEDWLDLIGALVRSSAAARDAYPIPELVDLIAGPGSSPGDTVFGSLLAARAEEAASTTEASVRDRLVAYLPRLARLLRALAFLADYQLVVPRATGGEVWMGPRRSHRPWIAIAPDLAHGVPILVDFDGRPVLQLAPLIQIAAPTPGAAEEMFLFAGGRRDRGRGARLVSEPQGFERLDDTVWDWFRAHLLGFDDAAPQRLERAPYRGLSSFTESDAGMFFGRERAADAFANQLLLQPLVAVVGPSGAGKSSFVQAGVLPRLPIGWRALVFRPGAAPRAALAARTELPAAIATEGDPAAIAAHLRGRTGEETLVLVVDQFEEIFTLCRDAAERARFAEVLVQAARSVDDRVRVILTLRDDFLVRAGELAPLRDRLAQGLTLLATPALDDLVRVVVEPARQAGYRFDDAELPLAMARAVAGQPGALALLSFTAARLWELRDRHFHQLTRKAYAAIGGVEGALAGHAEATLLACATDQQRLVREVFRHLVTAEGTRAVLGRDELIAALGGGVHGAGVIERLVAARLLVAAESERGEEQIEIVHEALLTSWPRLVDWQREDVASARLRDQLRIAAQQWHERGRPRGLLWRGEALEDYRRWRKQWPGAVPTTDLAFATASLDDDARGRRIRRAIAASAVSLLVAGVAALAVLYRSSSHNAAAAHDRLIASYEEQGRRLLLDGEYLRALTYLAEAYDQGDESTAVRFLLARAERLASAELAVYHHAGHASVAAFRPDRTHIISVSDNGEAAIWEAATGHAVALLPGRPGGPYHGKVSRDGAFVASSGRDGVVLWDGTRTRTIAARNADQIAIDPGGRRIAAASGGEISAWSAAGSPRLWTASTTIATAFAWWSGDAVVALGVDHAVRIVDGQGVLRLGASGPVNLLAVGADGTIATTSGAVIELWDATGTRRARIDGRATATAVAISPDGRWAAVAGDDQIVRLHEVASGAPLGELVGHRGVITSLEFSADGTRLASGGSDLAVRIWDVATRRQTTSLLGARDQYVRNGSHFDLTGARLVVPTWDGAIRVFTTATPDLVTSVDAEEALSLGEFFHGGRQFATSSDHGLQLWATTTGRKLAAITASSSSFSRISPDGKLVVILPEDTSVAELRDVDTGALVARLHGSGHFLWASFDHASQRVVTGSDDHLVELWTSHGERLATLRGHTDSVVSVAFSRDDRLIASGSEDRTARVWDIASTREIREVTGGDFMASVEFDTTGTRLLTGNADRLVRMWNIATGDPLRSFEHATTVRYASGNPDGTLVAGATADGSVSIWDSATSSLLVQFHHQASAESVEFLPGGPILLSASADHHAVLWHVDVEARSHEIVTAFARCHAPYALRETRLEPVTPSCHGE